MKTSESIKSIMPALIKAQAEFTNPSKAKSGYGYKYADLPTILDMCRPILAKHGLGIVQSCDTSEDGQFMLVETRVYHSSGEYIGDTMRLLIEKGKMNAMQSLGSAITYARRYSIQNLLSIVGDEDDDGKASGQPASNYQQRPQIAPRPQNNQPPRQYNR